MGVDKNGFATNDPIEVGPTDPLEAMAKELEKKTGCKCITPSSSLNNLRFVEEYRDTKIFLNDDNFVVTRECERYCTHIDLSNHTVAARIKAVKEGIDKARDFHGGGWIDYDGI